MLLTQPKMPTMERQEPGNQCRLMAGLMPMTGLKGRLMQHNDPGNHNLSKLELKALSQIPLNIQHKDIGQSHPTSGLEYSENLFNTDHGQRRQMPTSMSRLTDRVCGSRAKQTL